jgi:glycosyltransferase involved in cell wall biosynthesis
VSSYAIDSARGLSSRGHKIFFAGVRGGMPLKIARELGFQTIHICSRRNPFILSSIVKLKKLIETEHIGIVNVHTGSAYFLAYLVSLITGVKFAIVRTKSDILYPKKSFLYAKTERIIAASDLIKKQYLEIGVEPRKIVTIYQGIDTSAGHSGSGLPAVPAVGIVGRLDPVKGHKYFIEAAAIVLKKNPGVKFLVAGKEENLKYSELKKLAADKGITGSVEFCGFIGDVAGFMNKCTIGVIASTGSEAVSRVLLEWMNCGKAVVATGVGCIPEILPAEFIVPPENSEALAGVISRMLGDSAAVNAAGCGNKKIAAENFSFKKFIDETENLYGKIDHKQS